MTSTEANRIIKMSKQLDTINIKFDATKVKPYLDKQLPAGWDDEDNAPFECEFFEFLQGQDLLDLFIYRVEQQNKGEFKLQYDAWLYVQHAFTWSRLESPMWGDVSNTWYLKLTNLKQTK